MASPFIFWNYFLKFFFLIKFKNPQTNNFLNFYLLFKSWSSLEYFYGSLSKCNSKGKLQCFDACNNLSIFSCGFVSYTTDQVKLIHFRCQREHAPWEPFSYHRCLLLTLIKHNKDIIHFLWNKFLNLKWGGHNWSNLMFYYMMSTVCVSQLPLLLNFRPCALSVQSNCYFSHF